ncbi:MAG: hypothetical protein FJ151_05345, partial [Euryarchaeota archaeon]|nr:hypothetical protein [Euryarchaeota archaeon]
MSKTTKNLISVGAVLLILAVIYGCIFAFGLKPRLGLDLKGGISIVYEAQGKKVDAGVLDKTVEKIRDRIDTLGVAEPEISRLGERQIAVQLPGIHDSERAKGLIGQTAQLQFRLVLESKTSSEYKDDPAWEITTGEENLVPEKEVILPYTEEIMSVEAGEEEGTTKKEKMRIKLGPTLLSGDAIKKATFGLDDSGNPKVDFELNAEGSKKFGQITTDNVEKQLAIVL